MMDLMIWFNNIPSGIYSLLGVLLGFGLNLFKDWLVTRNKLLYVFQIDHSYGKLDFSHVDKSGPSGYIVEMYNCGKNSLLINSVTISNINDNNFIDIPIRETIVILPFHKYDLELCKQDYDTICWWYEKGNKKINIVKIISFTLDGKEISQKVKFPFIMFPVNDDFTPSEK
ncbi:hypothetical protein ACTUHY_01725 [Acidaminococcus sp. LBK-2]|uniref:hypothetical protein n=1 Tax=Acidaminococcus sp. LBK-2 TaxID=3456956 RepID=UPI003FA478ED